MALSFNTWLIHFNQVIEELDEHNLIIKSPEIDEAVRNAKIIYRRIVVCLSKFNNDEQSMDKYHDEALRKEIDVYYELIEKVKESHAIEDKEEDDEEDGFEFGV